MLQASIDTVPQGDGKGGGGKATFMVISCVYRNIPLPWKVFKKGIFPRKLQKVFFWRSYPNNRLVLLLRLAHLLPSQHYWVCCVVCLLCFRVTQGTAHFSPSGKQKHLTFFKLRLRRQPNAANCSEWNSKCIGSPVCLSYTKVLCNQNLCF